MRFTEDRVFSRGVGVTLSEPPKWFLTRPDKMFLKKMQCTGY